MNATVEIDEAGRLEVPEEMRKALHLVPGTKVTLSQTDNSIVIEPQSRQRGLHWKNGLLVYSFGEPLPPDHVNWLDQDRQERADQLMAK